MAPAGDPPIKSAQSGPNCQKCRKLKPGQPIWMVIQPGTEHLYFCSCNLYPFFPRQFYPTVTTNRTYTWSLDEEV